MEQAEKPSLSPELSWLHLTTENHPHEGDLWGAVDSVTGEVLKGHILTTGVMYSITHETPQLYNNIPVISIRGVMSSRPHTANKEFMMPVLENAVVMIDHPVKGRVEVNADWISPRLFRSDRITEIPIEPSIE